MSIIASVSKDYLGFFRMMMMLFHADFDYDSNILLLPMRSRMADRHNFRSVVSVFFQLLHTRTPFA